MKLKNIRVRNDFEAEIKNKDGKIRRLGAVGAFLVFLLFLSAYSDYVEKNTVYKNVTIFMPKNEINLEDCTLRGFVGVERSMWCKSGQVQTFPKTILLS